MPSTEKLLAGSAYLDAVSSLAQTVRATHPTFGLKEAADFQWSWRSPHPTDQIPQLFWFDEHDQPVAAITATGDKDEVWLDSIYLPDSEPAWIAHIVQRGLEHFSGQGFDHFNVEVDNCDSAMVKLFTDQGFTREEDGYVEAWLNAHQRPEISQLADGYRLTSRAMVTGPHHMINADRNHDNPEPRLLETSLYRDDLDLVMFDSDEQVAAYGLVWFDPESATAMIEPMRTEDDHQGRGLARHLLTTGVDVAARAGATRVKIVFESNDQVSRHLYLDVGFKPDRSTDLYRRTS